MNGSDERESDGFRCLTPLLHAAMFKLDILSILAVPVPDPSKTFVCKLDAQGDLAQDFYFQWEPRQGSLETEKAYRSMFLEALPQWVTELSAFHVEHLCRLALVEGHNLPKHRPEAVDRN
jgi:hypothetical protein